MLVTQSVQIRGLTAEQYEILRYQCRLASALDLDNLPEYNADNPQTYDFSGKRIKRGLYRTKDEKLVNSDINGSANIGVIAHRNKESVLTT